MGRLVFIAAVFYLVPASAAVGQTPHDELLRRIDAGAESMDAGVLLRAAGAARLIGEFQQAEEFLDRATAALRQADTDWVTEMIFQALASGKGANGMQRAFRDARNRIRMAPQDIASVANDFPSLLLGGEFDEMILSFTSDHADPDYRCACLAEKAWVHRVAGRQHESRVLWGELVAAWDRNPLSFDDPDAQANWQGQYARNLARAGRMADAREALQRAKAMPVSDDMRPSVQRRWAQTHAELGDVEGAVALLEPLIQSSTLVTVQSLSTRYTWEPVRNTLAFQEMLARNR